MAVYFHNHLNQLFEIQKVTGPGRKSSWSINDAIYKGKKKNLIFFFHSLICLYLDGAVRFISPIDPLFVCLPILEKASLDNQFRTLDDVFTRENVEIEGEDGEMDIHRLANIVPIEQLAHVCDSKDVGVAVYRLNNDLVLDWLVKKVDRLIVNASFVKTFKQTGLEQEHLKLDAVYTLANYLTNTWFTKLLDKLG